MSNDPRFNPPNFGSAPQTSSSVGVPNLNINVTDQAVTTPAGFWIRFVAVAIDGIIVYLAIFPLSFGLGIVAPIVAGDGMASKILIQVISMVINLTVTFYYYGWFYSNKGATPGKLVLGLKVLHAQTGGHLTYGRAFVRETVAKFVSGILLMIGFIMAGLRTDKRALHDLIVDTQVIKTK